MTVNTYRKSELAKWQDLEVCGQMAPSPAADEGVLFTKLMCSIGFHLNFIPVFQIRGPLHYD